ncbi:hypothetical protein C8J57DRAFT_1502501 [Mycena rebaudengoi]|nr:hypothetical protein C8J57DRAFT_1502501 [Mycena rebaudengoi]
MHDLSPTASSPQDVPSGSPPAPSSVAGFYAFVPYPPGTVPLSQVSVPDPPSQLLATQPVPVAQPAPAILNVAAPAPVAAPGIVPTSFGQGLPTLLLPLLRTGPPYEANTVYRVVPMGPLAAILEPHPAPEWYAITRGRFVGVVDQYALSQTAIASVPNAARKAYDTQALVLHVFNQAITWGGVQVVL